MKLKYEPALDGLRALSVLAVAGFHARAPFAPGGIFGVDVFFVLSGYLITSILADGSLTPQAFWKRRIARLLPALMAMVATMVAIAPWILPEWPNAWRDALLSVTYTMNVALAAEPWDNPLMHTWSLGTEAQFYLLWPFALPAILKCKNPGLVLLWLWIAVVLVQRAIHALTPIETHYLPHVSGLILGSALAFLPPLNRWWGLAGFALVLVSVTVRGFDSFAAEVGSGLLISAVRQPCALRAALSWKPLVQLGIISYGVYLWHLPIMMVVMNEPWMVRGSVALMGAIVLALASYHWMERPLTRMVARPAVAG